MAGQTDLAGKMAAVSGRVKGKTVVPQAELPPFYNFDEVGDNISGVIVSARQIDGEYGKQDVVDIAVTDEDGKQTGEKVSVTCTTRLKPLLELIGKDVTIVYNGTRGRMKMFDIYK